MGVCVGVWVWGWVCGGEQLVWSAKHNCDVLNDQVLPLKVVPWALVIGSLANEAQSISVKTPQSEVDSICLESGPEYENLGGY